MSNESYRRPKARSYRSNAIEHTDIRKVTHKVAEGMERGPHPGPLEIKMSSHRVARDPGSFENE